MSGFSVIELMVTVTVMMLLAVASAPFASSWGHQANVRHSQSILTQGMAQLKAAALRNNVGAASGTASAVMLSYAGHVCVQLGAPATMDCSNAWWRAVPPATITLNGASSQCVALDSTGMPVAATVGSLVCGTTLAFSISKGGETSNGSLN